MNNQRKWYQTNLVIILTLIFIFPIGFILMWLHASWKKPIKILITVLITIIAFAAYSGKGENTSQVRHLTEEKQQLEKEIDALEKKNEDLKDALDKKKKEHEETEKELKDVKSKLKASHENKDKEDKHHATDTATKEDNHSTSDHNATTEKQTSNATSADAHTDVTNASKAEPPQQQAPVAKSYANCTALRQDFPHGVPAGHPSYSPKLDRDKDGFACER